MIRIHKKIPLARYFFINCNPLIVKKQEGDNVKCDADDVINKAFALYNKRNNV